MRILVTVEPGLSHSNAVIPVANVLQNAGHNLLVAGGPSTVANFRQAGLPGRSVVSDPLSPDDFLQEVPSLRTIRPQDRIQVTRREISVRHRAVTLVKALLPLIDDWRPDLILRDSTELGGWAAAERRQIPHAAIEVGLFWTPEDWHGPDGSALVELLVAAGLPKGWPISTLYRYLLLGTSPPGFLPPDIELPASTRRLRPTFHDNYGGEFSLPPAGDWAFLTFGTVYRSDEDKIRALAAELAKSFQHVLVSGSFDAPAPNVTVARYIPLSLVVSRCAVVVCHGGRNTVLTALSAGVPVVCAPIASDQFITSDRVSKLRVGQSCSWSVGELRDAAVQVARQNTYRDHATHFSNIISAMPPVDAAGSIIRKFFEDSRRPAS